ncbi:MAG: twin-arginine translocase TatA/TatE family subunit [Polyangiaceae bacterium]|nr:twin-arginine translocase TatA/TatE family subunit [Polyangiaceae bacterium]
MAVGPTQILIIILVVVVLFGASRIPLLGKNLGAGLRNFKDGLTGGDSDDAEDALSNEPRPKQVAAKKPPKKKKRKRAATGED